MRNGQATQIALCTARNQSSRTHNLVFVRHVQTTTDEESLENTAWSGGVIRPDHDQESIHTRIYRATEFLCRVHYDEDGCMPRSLACSEDIGGLLTPPAHTAHSIDQATRGIYVL